MNAVIKTIRKSMAIHAPREKVWNVLQQDYYTRIWFAEFSAGTYAQTDWQLGSKAIFKDHSNSGIFGTIVVNRPFEVISIEYEGMIIAGKEDYESDYAKAVKGTRETYRLLEKEGVTQLSVECDMAEEYFDMMSAAWDKAIDKIKELAER